MSLAHENERHTCQSLQLLGVKPDDIIRDQDESSIHGTEGLMPLSVRDRRKAITMLGRVVEQDDAIEATRDLQLMLMLNVKAEIQILEAREGGLASWLSQRLNPAS